MNLERLANELFLELFEYLGSVHLLRGFSYLNSRFDTLLIAYVRVHGLDFRAASKDDFDLICRQNLPSIIEQIIALRLSNDDNTPHQIDIFLCREFPLQRFIHLQSLSLYCVCSNELVSKLVLQCRHLPLLTRLDFIKCLLKYHRKTLLNILKHIWRLPKLVHCHLDWNYLYNDRFLIPTIRSKSIQYLSISNFKLNFSELVRLFRSTPNIRHFIIGIDDPSDDQQFPSVIPSISSLKLHVNGSKNVMINLLKNVPNLIHLTILTQHININGHEWKQIIVDHLPKLKVFRLQMHFRIDNSNGEQEEIDQILDTYRTSFWLIDHKLFVRCQWKTDNPYSYVLLYTLPFSFDVIALQPAHFKTGTKSTCPSANDYWSYDRVTVLHYESSKFNDPLLSHIRFYNIKHLEIELPFCDRFLSILPSLDHLTSLSVSSDSEADSDIVLSQLQILIDRAPRLYSLTIGGWSSSIVQEIPSNITSRSIRRLDFQSSHYPRRDRCFNSEQCAFFIRSPLAIQCEVLLIVVENRRHVFDLINQMTNLRALKVECELDHSNNNAPTMDELIQWVSSGFSRAFVEDITRNEIIRLWVR